MSCALGGLLHFRLPLTRSWEAQTPDWPARNTKRAATSLFPTRKKVVNHSHHRLDIQASNPYYLGTRTRLQLLHLQHSSHSTLTNTQHHHQELSQPSSVHSTYSKLLKQTPNHNQHACSATFATSSLPRPTSQPSSSSSAQARLNGSTTSSTVYNANQQSSRLNISGNPRHPHYRAPLILGYTDNEQGSHSGLPRPCSRWRACAYAHASPATQLQHNPNPSPACT